MDDEIAKERLRRRLALADFAERNAIYIRAGLKHVHGIDLAEEFTALEFAQRTVITRDEIET